MPRQVEELLADAEIPVEFEDQREEALYRVAVQGNDVRGFLDSPAGKFVIGAALQDQAEIEHKLATTSVMFGRKKIQELQLEHRAITLAISWLTDAVRIGLDGERTIMDERYSEGD